MLTSNFQIWIDALSKDWIYHVLQIELNRVLLLIVSRENKKITKEAEEWMEHAIHKPTQLLEL